MRDETASGLIILLDENLSGRRILNGLIEQNIPVKPQTEIMDRGALDSTVLDILSHYPTYFLLTKDSDFHKKKSNRIKILDDCLGVFYIASHKDKTGAELVDLISISWKRINKFIINNHRPFVARILADGRVEKLCPVFSAASEMILIFPSP